MSPFWHEFWRDLATLAVICGCLVFVGALIHFFPGRGSDFSTPSPDPWEELMGSDPEKPFKEAHRKPTEQPWTKL